MRHAAAAPAGIDVPDYERPLTAAGRAAAARAAHQLAAERAAVDRVLYSPARRTRETAAILAGELLLAPGALREVAALYLATPAAMRAAIGAQGGAVPRLMIIGHNPGLSDFGAELDARFAGSSLATAGVWRFRLDPQAWRALHSTVQKQ